MKAHKILVAASMGAAVATPFACGNGSETNIPDTFDSGDNGSSGSSSGSSSGHGSSGSSSGFGGTSSSGGSGSGGTGGPKCGTTTCSSGQVCCATSLTATACTASNACMGIVICSSQTDCPVGKSCLKLGMQGICVSGGLDAGLRD
jgi:hypothetical protein